MFRSLSAALLATSMLAMPAHAQSAVTADGDVAALRAEIAALKAQLAALEARVDSATAAAPTAPAQVAAAPTVTAKPATDIAWKGAPELKTADGWSFKPRGRIQIDAGQVNAPKAITDTGLGFVNELRRVRLGVEGTMPGGFGYKLEGDFAEGGVDLTDAFLTYKSGPLKVTVGQHNNFQSLDELTSSNDSSFIERAAFTDAFGFERRVGVSAELAKGALLLQGGVFTDSFADLGDDGNNSVSLDGRVVFAPKFGSTQLHFGASAHRRSLGDAITTVRYRQRPLIHASDVRFLATPAIAARREQGYGLEGAVIAGRLHGMAEAYWHSATRAGPGDANFFGGAIEAGLFLTDDTRSYRDGYFRGIKVKHPVGKGGIGAVQLNLRYDYLDLNDGTIRGGQQRGVTASLIWSPIDYLRFMLNYGRLDYRDAAIPAGASRDYNVDVLGARAQVSF